MTKIEKIEIDVAMQGHITNCYLVYNENKEAILIDPADNATKIINRIVECDAKVKYIVITHAHGDHIGALIEVQKYTKATILVHENDTDMLLGKEENYCEMLLVEQPDIDATNLLSVKDGYTFKLGTLDFEVILTKGHSSGCICLYEKNSNVLFTGDTLFSDCYGRCDLNTGSFDDMVASLRKLFDRFTDIMIYPGHGKSVNINTAKRYIRMLMAMKGVEL
ncbi:MAG: MBL fold metallo-hydrolase [Clostridia bacterium]|nr:MBL fold metallo-hydrolase [Clostridia bacterium]